MDKKQLLKKITKEVESNKFIIKKTINHNNGDITIKIGEKEDEVPEENKPPVEPSVPTWWKEFKTDFSGFKIDLAKKFDNIDKKFDNIDKKFDNIDKKFDNIDKKLDNHIRDFDKFKSDQETFNKKLLECPTITAELQNSKTQE